jgi:hypothetical protein
VEGQDEEAVAFRLLEAADFGGGALLELAAVAWL